MTNRAAGWTSWLMEPPPKSVLLRFWQEYTDQEWTGYAEDVTPSGCLWWKLTGIESVGHKSPGQLTEEKG
jgi:hypothetical protein